MNENNYNSNSQPVEAHFKKTPGFAVYEIIKRVCDIVFSFFALVFAAIPMLIIAAAVKFTSKGPAIFKQKRVGKNGEIFYCLKFRSMFTSAPASCASKELEKADSYITPVGNILRKTSLDELPQLINILKGEMSFIGPRPLIPEEEYIHTERKRLGVYYLRPGISGLAQINGRDYVKPEEKVKYDKEYLDNFGLAEDIKILIKTVLNVLSEKDIHEGEMTED